MKTNHVLEVSFEHFPASVELENHILEGIDDFSRVNLRNSRISVFLRREGIERFHVAIKVSAKRHIFIGRAQGRSPFTAFKQAKHNVLRQFFRFKTKKISQARGSNNWLGDQSAMAT